MITRKKLKTLQNYKENMSVHVSVRMSKIMCRPVKVGVRTYATYVHCRTLTVCSPHVPMSISGESFSVSLFSAISSKNFKFTLGPSEDICKKLFLSSSMIPDMKLFWILVEVAPSRNEEPNYVVSTFLLSSSQNLITMSIYPL